MTVMSHLKAGCVHVPAITMAFSAWDKNVAPQSPTSHHEWQVFGKFTVLVISVHLNEAERPTSWNFAGVK